MILLAQMILDPMAAGMGNAYTSLAASPYAAYYNPSVLPNLSGKVLVATSTRLLAYNGDYGTGFSNLGTSIFVAVPSVQAFTRTKKKTAQDVALGFGVMGTGSSFQEKRIFVGVGLKSKVSKFGFHTDVGFSEGKTAVKAGAALILPLGGFYTIGGRVYYDTASSWIDNAFSVRYTREEFGLTVAVEGSLVRGVNNINGYIPVITDTSGKKYYYAVLLNFGIEKRLNDKLLVRIGSYNFHPTVGFSVDLPYVQISYAYVGSITAQHTFGVKVAF